jgi:cell division septation protein DedD
MSYHQFGHIDPDERIDYAEEPPPDDALPPRRHLAGAALAVGVMAIFAGGLWFAYHEGSKHAGVTAPASPDAVPLIRADTDPVKVKPDKAGGMIIPDKDDPLYALHPGTVPAEHILPPPEAPAPRPVAPPPAPPPAVAAAPAAPGPAPLPAPPQAATPAKPAVKPAEAPAKPAGADATTKVQLASLRTPEEARDEWARLKRENADLLGKFTAVAVRADLGERGVYYRVEAGPVGDRAAAVRLCKALKERDLGCQLVQ